MKLILTSFGVSHLRRRDQEDSDIFYRMPPASMSQVNVEFMPDYSTLLLADQIILDERTYDRLTSGTHPSFGTMAVLVKMLYEEGFIRLENFDSVIQKNHLLLQSVLERDLGEVDAWIRPLRESLRTWKAFVDSMGDLLRDEIVKSRLEPKIHGYIERSHHYRNSQLYQFALVHELSHEGQPVSAAHLIKKAIISEKGRGRVSRSFLRLQLIDYLSYVNANLLLCDVFDCGLHDWHDFAPFYREKFLRVAKREMPGEKRIESVRKLFEVTFPEFTFWDPHNVIRALKDKRIEELRQLVDQAAAGNVTFDRAFAVRVLNDVLKIERGIASFRSVVSYVTMPLGFIPVWGTPAQKAVEEAVMHPVASMNKRGFRWFYLISQLAERHRRTTSD